MRKVWLVLILLLGTGVVFGQSMSVTATLTDSDSTVWANGTCSIRLYNGQSIGYQYNGVAVPIAPACSINSSGVLSATMYNTNTMSPVAAQYQLNICSDTSAPCSSFLTTVTTTNQTSAFSALLVAPRFSAVYGSFGYADVEITNVVAGVYYYNVTSGMLRQFNGSTWNNVSAGGAIPESSASTIGIMYGFGDSTTSGLFATVGTASTFGILARDFPGPTINNGVPSAWEAFIVSQLFNLFPVQWSGNQVPTIFSQGGINDAANGNTTGSLNNFSLELDAGMYWGSLPLANKKMASTATASGFASSYTGPAINNSVIGNPKESITNGDTLSFSITPNGTKIGVTYAARVTSGGTFTVKIDGANQTDVCSNTTTFSGFGCNSVAVNNDTFFRQEFSVTPGISHTVLVTVTSASGAGNQVSIIDADSTPTSKSGLVTWLQNGVIRQYLDNASASTAAFNTTANSVATQGIADNLNLIYVDVRGGTPGVNTTSDMAANTTACPAQSGNTALHPNNCGYLDWSQTVENAAAGVFFPGIGGRGTSFYGPLTSYQLANIGDSSSIFWNNNTGNILPSVNQYSPLYCSLGFSNGMICNGLNWDPTHGTYVNALISYLSAAIQNCSLPNPSTCTDYAFWDQSGNLTNEGNITAPSVTGSSLGSSTSPLCTTTGGLLTHSGCTSGLTGTTASIGGSALLAGNCATGTATVTGAVVGRPVYVSASDGTLPNALAVLSAAVTSTNTVSVQVCAIAAVTPAAKTYNIATY